jgi:hypothetical protein
MGEMCSINLWINEERYERLNKIGLADMTKDVLAGMKVLQLQCTGEQKDRILKIYPMAKWDSATTKSIELIPAEAKDKMFNLVVEKGDLDVMEVFLKGVS